MKVISVFAFISVVIVVLSIALGITVAQQGALIILHNAQQVAGSRDILITPKQETKLNGTYVEQLFSQMNPRFFSRFSAQIGSQLVNMLVTDTHQKLKHPSDIIISETIAREIGFDLEDNVEVQVDISSLLESIPNNPAATNRTITIPLQCRIQIIESNYQNIFTESDFKRTIVIDQSGFLELLQQSQELDKSIIRLLRKITLKEYSDFILLDFPQRYHMLTNSDVSSLVKSAARYTSNVGDTLGFQFVQVSMPLVEEIFQLRFASLYLYIIMKMVNFLIFFLSCLLVNNYLTITLDARVQEIATRRLIGTNKQQIYFMVIFSSVKLLLPAIIIGLILSFPSLLILENVISDIVSANGLSVIKLDTFIWSFLVASVVPVIGSIQPIRNILSIPLIEALDHNYSKTKAMRINILKEDHNRTDRLIFALICVAFGCALYYFLPVSVFTFAFMILLFLMFGVLIGFLAGFILLSLNVSHQIELFLYRIVRIYTNKVVSQLAYKNLSAHRIRNRRTSLMYSVSISFVMFLWTAIHVVLQSNYDYQVSDHGADIHIKAHSKFSSPQLFEELLQQQKENIYEWSWVTQSLKDYQKNNGYEDVQITQIGNIYRISVDVFGVSPNILTSSMPKYWELWDSLDEDFVEFLYSAQGQSSLTIPVGIAGALDKYTGQYVQLLQLNGTYSKRNILEVSAITEFAPGFYNSDKTSRSCLVSIPTYIDLAGLQKMEDLPLQRLLIKVKKHASKIVTLLNQIIRDNEDSDKVQLFSLYQQKEILYKNQVFIELIFISLIVIVMLLSCFSLVTSMTANVDEQIKEIAVLKAMGLSSELIQKVYNREAFILIMSSSIVGVAVGNFVGYTITQQTAIFRFAAGHYSIPWLIIVVIMITATSLARISTTQAIRAKINKSTSELLKME